MMDRIDRKILAELQQDCTLPIARLADRVGLSASPCWKRVQRLEETGVITGRVAVVDPRSIGIALTVLTEVEGLDHTADWRQRFLAAIDAIPQIVEVLRLGGVADYMLRIVTTDMAAYDAIYTRLTQAVPLKSVTSRFVLETIRKTTTLPILLDD
jgi:Lrp/AsnC family transcriptional regulator